MFGGEDEIRPAHLVKLVLIGDSGVGKTCILTRFVDNEFSSHFYSTIGVDFKARTLLVNDQRVKVQIWDTAGQERFRTITSSYYRGAKGIMIIYNVGDLLSFENAESWLEEARKYSEPSTIKLLVGNKADLPESQRQVSAEEAKKFAQKHNIPWIETSAKIGTNVTEAFQVICQRAIEQNQTEPAMDSTRRSGMVELKSNSQPPKRSCC